MGVTECDELVLMAENENHFFCLQGNLLEAGVCNFVVMVSRGVCLICTKSLSHRMEFS